MTTTSADVPPLVVVQARTGSTRLPGKVLADLDGEPMLGFQLRRLGGLPDAQIVVATSDRPADDAVADVAATVGVAVVRGPEDDVLGRFMVALDAFPAPTVVRLTGDCPLTDPGIVGSVLAHHTRHGADYTSNVLPRSFPKGLDVEVVSAAALRVAQAEATDPADREHVTPYLYRQPGRFRLANVDSGRDLGEEWWTVDTASDLARVRTLVASVVEPRTATWLDYLAAAGTTTPVGPVHLRPSVAPEVGSNPWVRTWDAIAAGSVVGVASVTVGTDPSGGPIRRRRVDVERAWLDATEAALDDLLTGDQQTRD